MTPEVSLVMGGLFNLAFAVFHMLFWRIFDWKRDLRSLTFNNRQIMQVLNLCLIFAFVIFAWISFFHGDELLRTALWRSMLILISLFWFLRAIEQALFFRLKQPASVAFLILFLTGTLLYAYPWMVNR
jgi:hypothetical protein